MPADTGRSSRFLEFAAIFLLIYFGMQFALRTFFPGQFEKNGAPAGVVFTMVDATVKEGHHPVIVVRNATDASLALPDRCPMPPVGVFRVESPGTDAEILRPRATEETALPCVPLVAVGPRAKTTIDLGPWKYSMFSELGTYEVRLSVTQAADGAAGDSAAGPNPVARFTIHRAGPMTQVFRTFITKPMLNFLIFEASLLPGHNLGVAIIILTFLVKLLLFLPTQHALEGQRKMPAVQPKIEALRKQYKDDPKRLQEETMKLWKTEKVNPFQSCLPMLVQFPVLIGLFFVVRDGGVLELSRHLLYGTYLHLDWAFGTHFLGLDLKTPSVYVLPPLLVLLQFAQMKLSFAMAKKKKEEKEGKKEEKKLWRDLSQAEMQQKMMLYGLPFLIGFFAIKFPAAVSLYWGISTVFAIGQQIVVNRKS